MIFAQIWMNSIGEDVATKKRVYLYSQYINKHIIIHTYIQYMYVYIRDDVTQNLQLIIPGMHWLTKKNDQGTAGCRPDSPAIPSSSASCTSNCYRHVLSDMVDVGWVFLKMTPMLDVSLSLWTCGMAKARHWKPCFSTRTRLEAQWRMHTSSTSSKKHILVDQQSWFHLESLTSYITPHFNLAMNAKLPQHHHFSHFFLPNWDLLSGSRWAAGPTWLEGSSHDLNVHLTELRSKNQTKTPKKNKTSTSFEFGVDKIYIFYCNPVAPHFTHLNSKDFLCFKQCHTVPALGSFGVIQAPF